LKNVRPSRTHKPGLPATAALLCLLTLGCAALAAPAPAKRPAKRKAAHGGVSLTYDAALARDVKAETVPAEPLAEASDKPDGVFPEHVAFTLVGLQGAPANSYLRPLVRVCPVAEYLKAFSVSPRYVRIARRTLGDLRRLIRTRPAALRGEVPTLPFPDGHDAFHAHVKYLRFRGGSGVAFLTQGQQDNNLINSQQVSYEFRGLTYDGRFYVSATFPVGAAVIADSRDADSHEGYAVPYYAAVPREPRYRAYVGRVRRKLERLRPDEFRPSLRLYDELLTSLEIRK